MPGNKAVPWGHSVSLSGWWHIDRRQLLGVTAGDVSAVESAARAWQSEHYFYKQFSVAELAKCRTTLRCWMKLTPDRIWMGTHSYTLTKIYRSDENNKLTHSHSLSSNLQILQSSNITLFKTHTHPHSHSFKLSAYSLIIFSACCFVFCGHGQS